VPSIYLSLGSNIGDRAANLRVAIAALPSAGVTVVRVSSFYETEPVDFLDQAWFLNCVVEAQTDLPPHALLLTLRNLETQIGGKAPSIPSFDTIKSILVTRSTNWTGVSGADK